MSFPDTDILEIYWITDSLKVLTSRQCGSGWSGDSALPDWLGLLLTFISQSVHAVRHDVQGQQPSLITICASGICIQQFRQTVHDVCGLLPTNVL